jgi:hypothetical protein
MNHTDVWATPTVGRVVDTNCDGAVDELDPPNVIFVSGNARGTCCSCGGFTPSTCLTGVLRVLDGRTGDEVWSLRRASSGSIGFAGLSVALADIDGDGALEIAAVTGEGRIVIVSNDGDVLRASDRALPDLSHGSFGWGGGLAIGDIDGDGSPEIAYGNTVFTTAGGGLTWRFTGMGGVGGPHRGAAVSILTDADGDAAGDLELVAGRTAYQHDGTVLWNRTDLSDGFAATGNFDAEPNSEIVLVHAGQVSLLDSVTGATELGPATLPGMGTGGPPTVADFDGDDRPEIGVANANFYTVFDPDYAGSTLRVLWQAANHDLSSSVTGSTVFDFEGDGIAEVIYNDECFLWVYDGPTGNVRFAALTTSFTATEASAVADVDGDGHAEILMISNGADPSSAGWGCDVAPWNRPDAMTGRPAWEPPATGTAYRGITVLGDRASAWVGTRTLWNQHSYHVSNVCDGRDGACEPAGGYGSIPRRERRNWEVPWLNNYRQNVQESGLFNAPDGVLTLTVECTSPLRLIASLRNLGSAVLPAGVNVGFYVRRAGTDTLLGTASTTDALFPAQVAELVHDTTAADGVTETDVFVAKILIDPMARTFHECREDNNESDEASARCLM